MAIKKDADKKYLTQGELKKLFDTIERKGSNRDYVMFQIAYNLGLRAGEVGLMKVGDYCSTTKEIYIHSLKGSIKRAVRLDDHRARILNKYLKESELEDNDYIFPSLTRRNKGVGNKMMDVLMKRYAKLAKISRDNFHSLKHSMGVHLAESGADVKEIQYHLRHKRIQNTLIYFKFTTYQQNSFYDKIYSTTNRIVK